MKIITLSHQKGGVGKSTLALNLAYTLQLAGVNVGLFDSDPQGSLNNPLISEGLSLVNPETPISQLRRLKYDYLVVDTPPYLSAELGPLYNISDLIVVPTRAGIFDAVAIGSTIAMIQKARVRNPSIKAGIVFNLVKHHSSLKGEARGLLDNYNFKIFDSFIIDRTCYVRTVLEGGVHNSGNPKAIAEFTDLANELISEL